MDDAVKPRGPTTLMNAMLTTAMAAMLACCAPAHAAQAKPLADPTRPPASLAKVLSGPAAIAAPDAAAGPVLQSVLMARQPGGRQVAVIDGETVRLGGAFRGAVLVRMTNTEVELQRGASRQVLKLFAAPAATSAKK